MNKDDIIQDINYYTEMIKSEELLLKAHKVRLEQSYKQLERLEAKNENEIYKNI